MSELINFKPATGKCDLNLDENPVEDEIEDGDVGTVVWAPRLQHAEGNTTVGTPDAMSLPTCESYRDGSPRYF